MKKIGLITLHSWWNYGSMLQAYAANMKLNQMGYDCELIDYVPPKIYNIRSYRLYNEEINFGGKREKYIKEMGERKARFKAFEKLYKLSQETWGSDEDIEKRPPKYDVYITGGDQLWNVNMRIESKAYFLHFTESMEKYAFSTSVGRCESEKLKKYSHYLDKYKKIFMREMDGKKKIEKITKQKDLVDVMIDPTLQLGVNDWNKIIDEKRLIDESYIGCYSTLDSEVEAMLPILEELHKLTKMKIVLFGMIIPIEKEWLENYVACGPLEMLNLIKNAEYVVTNSFHGTVFSILFNKYFFTYNDQKENPRKEGLVKMFNLENRIIYDKSELCEKLTDKIDYDEVNKKIEELRFFTEKQIRECLGK